MKPAASYNRLVVDFASKIDGLQRLSPYATSRVGVGQVLCSAVALPNIASLRGTTKCSASGTVARDRVPRDNGVGTRCRGLPLAAQALAFALNVLLWYAATASAPMPFKVIWILRQHANRPRHAPRASTKLNCDGNGVSLWKRFQRLERLRRAIHAVDHEFGLTVSVFAGPERRYETTCWWVRHGWDASSRF